jgi:thiamine-phosphate pyrophosphorylase
VIANYLRLCLVTHLQDMPIAEYQLFLLKAIAGGVTSVQLREKNKTYDEILHIAQLLKTLLKPFNIPLIINDNVDIAKAVDAEGVHVGQSDSTPVEARKILGPDKIIGWSVETLDQLAQANKLDCINYIAASTVFPSVTKTNCKTIWGLTGLKTIAQQSKYPVVAIGGIDATNAGAVMNAGACGVAVIGAIHDADDPTRAAQDLITACHASVGWHPGF